MLAAFIREKTDAIIQRWMAMPYADPCVSGGAVLSRFRPEVAALLDAIAGYAQGGEMRQERSVCEAASLNVCAERYAVSHLTSGLSEVQLVLTLQALRNVVLQLWAENVGESDLQMPAAIIRVHPAFDNALCAAMDHYCRVKNWSHGLFLKTLAHDLRNPLGGLELTAQMMQQDAMYAAEKISKIASSISRAVDNVMIVADDIYDVGTLHEGLGISVNPVELDAASVCRKLVDEFTSRYPSQAILFEATGPLVGLFDESRIEQAFANMISYASRHTAMMKPVTVKLQAASDAMIFSVRYFSDSLALNEAEAMFDPLRRYATHVLSKKGPLSELGMSLYIAREIIIAHEGEINATADQGWMTFEARLPHRTDPV